MKRPGDKRFGESAVIEPIVETNAWHFDARCARREQSARRVSSYSELDWGATLEDAFFVPPSPEEVPDLMDDLEKFWHNSDIAVPHLIRVAISHYQFETIHPFLDGNGRMGRLLITLYLVTKKFLNKPSLYLSAHLEKNKGAYYDALTLVRTSHDMRHWIKFFLVAVAETADAGKGTFQKILRLCSDAESRISPLGKRVPIARKLLESLQRAFCNHQ